MSSHEPSREPDVEPLDPEDADVPGEAPEPMQLEPARLLANDARPHLRAQGFDDEQVERWAETYVARVGEGSVDDFLAWIEQQESG